MAERLTNVVRCECQHTMADRLYWCSAWLEPDANSSYDLAPILENVNILCRDAPYMYLLANGFSSVAEANEAIGLETGYEHAFEAIDLRRGVWLCAPQHSSDIDTVALIVYQNDLAAIAPLLRADEYCLLCLPIFRTLSYIDETVSHASDATTAASELLGDGGFALCAPDGDKLTLWATNPKYRRYFECANTEGADAPPRPRAAS